MFGLQKIPLSIKFDDLILFIEKERNGFIYYRKSGSDEIEQYIFADECKLLINPVEPVNIPKRITHYLLIELDKKLVLAPKRRQIVYIKFPVEIGVFIVKADDRTTEVLDIFSISYKKYILYGEIPQGILCKCFKSEVYAEIPEIDILKEGIIRLDIINKTGRWITVSKAVFDAYHMKLYYNNSLVAMEGVMTIVDEKMAKTAFKDSPLEKGMEKTFKLYALRKISKLSNEFVMEWGI